MVFEQIIFTTKQGSLRARQFAHLMPGQTLLSELSATGIEFTMDVYPDTNIIALYVPEYEPEMQEEYEKINRVNIGEKKCVVVSMPQTLDKIKDAIKKHDKAPEADMGLFFRSTFSDYRDMSSEIAEKISTSEKVTLPLVFVVDDDIFYLREVSKMLGKKYTVRACSSPGDFLNKIEKEIPAAIVMDYDMPGVTGEELTAMLRNMSEFQKVPIILISGISAELAQYVVETNMFTAYINKREIGRLKDVIADYVKG